MPFLKRMPTILKRIPFPKHVDYICYTPEEYEKIKDESALLIDAVENSIEIAT
jgi:poly(A) polymerase Pap1